MGITDAGLQLAAFAGALAAVTLVYRLAGAARQADPLLGLLLVGLVVGALLGAAIGLLKILADPRDQLPAMTFWLLGSLAGIGSADLPALLLTLLQDTLRYLDQGLLFTMCIGLPPPCNFLCRLIALAQLTHVRWLAKPQGVLAVDNLCDNMLIF